MSVCRCVCVYIYIYIYIYIIGDMAGGAVSSLGSCLKFFRTEGLSKYGQKCFHN